VAVEAAGSEVETLRHLESERDRSSS
jgi:hypothetical protein